MIKWGRKKPSSASSSSTSSHASPFSWLPKLKHMRINSDPNSGKKKKNQNSTPFIASSPQYSCEYHGDIFCAGNEGAACRWQSFNEDKSYYEEKKNKVIDDEHEIHSSSCHGGRMNSASSAKKHGRRESTLKLKEKDIGVGEERKFNGAVLEKDEIENKRETEYENLRRRFEKTAQKVFQEQLLTLEREQVEKDVLQFDSPRTICTPRTHCLASSEVSKSSILRNIIEKIEKSDRASQKRILTSDHQRQNLKVKTNKENQPREVQRMRKQKPASSKVRLNSPRMVSKVEVCKIKAIEDMRKAKLKMKKDKEEEIVVEETGAGVDSFAVIKCSLDPRQDFRDSMIEMIVENEIREPEEMEDLLACYLTLNADEYHDLIIKVFRQVWFDLNQGGFGINSEMQSCCYE
ncbi:hypothetical protein RJT34_13888 [Clitoria ternatea]|uniref:Transcription repressor n=1 Tax=Clitoria ternatea TaxID=43366 RepID=A0AAN9PM61_CLITE